MPVRGYFHLAKTVSMNFQSFSVPTDVSLRATTVPQHQSDSHQDFLASRNFPPRGTSCSLTMEVRLAASSSRGGNELLANLSNASDFSYDTTVVTDPDISTRCEKCQEDLDGPCYEHTDIQRIIFDKPPVPLAHSSLPDALEITNIQSAEKEEMIFTKQKVEASTLLGPLIGPLVPLDEWQGGPPRYTIWSEETQEVQVYDLSDDFLCNWIKFIRPSSSVKEANVIAYQQRGSIYLVAVRDILPSTEMRVYMKPVRSSCAANYQLALFVQSLHTSCKRENSVERETVMSPEMESEVTEQPPPKRKRRSRAMKITLSEAAEEMGTTSTEPVLADSKDSKSCEVPTVEQQRPREELYPEILDALQRKRRQEGMKKWKLQNARYKSGKMTEEEKDLFEKDERTVEHKKKIEERYARATFLRKQKMAQMTKEEREAHLAHNKNKLQILFREKFVAGLTLTPQELAQYGKVLAQRRGYNDQVRKKRRLAAGKDPDATDSREGGKPGRIAMFDWQLAEQGSAGVDLGVDTEELPTVGKARKRNWTASYSLKMRQGLPLTEKEQAAYQKMINRSREYKRAHYRRTRIAEGLDPKEVPSRRKAPLQIGTNLNGESERKVQDDEGKSSQDNNNSESVEDESHRELSSVRY